MEGDDVACSLYTELTSSSLSVDFAITEADSLNILFCMKK